ncbi:transporter substrate-binding domain-containing protein [Burkholderia anthina]|uniref:transporter substrate-binding domain-containing protein n=1 Tax=Burkholderia anthina TaxID=179879 RepID=UPI003C7B335F
MPTGSRVPLAADGLPRIKSARLVPGWCGRYVCALTYEDATGRLTGFDVDIAVAIAQRLGVQLEFVEDKWDEPRAIDLALQPGSVPTL